MNEPLGGGSLATVDSTLGLGAGAPGPAAEPNRRLARWRGLFEWSATTAPVALLLAAGIAVGPFGIHLLSRSTLTLLEPVLPVALAALGVLVGVNVGDRRAVDRWTLAAAWGGAAITALVVSAGIGGVAVATWPALTGPLWTVILAAGICAASSLTLPSDASLRPASLVTRVIELGVLFPVVVGGVMLAWMRAGTAGGGVVLVASSTGVVLVLAAAAWLLLSSTAQETDERVYVVSALLLVGGVAAAQSWSALLAGLVAGGFWRVAGRRPRETIRRDVLFVQHPLLVLVLLVAGARAELSLPTFALGAVYAALRIAGQLAAGAAMRRLLDGDVPRGIGLLLQRPGVFGAGFALNAAGVLGEDASLLLATVVIGTIGSEVAAVVWTRRSTDE